MKFKKTLAIIGIIINLISLTACQKGPVKNDAPVGDQSVDLPMDFHETYGILEYITNTDNGPRILYSVEEKIAKDSEVTAIYVMKDGKCRRYLCPEDTTMGDLSQMTDEEVVKKMQTHYDEELQIALRNYLIYGFKKSDFDFGNITMFQSDYYPIQSVGFTDDSGNRVINQLLMFPLCAYPVAYFDDYNILTLEGHEEFVIKSLNKEFRARVQRYDNLVTDFHYSYLNSSFSYPQKIYMDIWCEPFYISQNSMQTGVVYSSIYFGFRNSESQWTDDVDQILCFRDNNAYALDIELDQVSSNNHSHIDPESYDILKTAGNYGDLYKNGFKKVDVSSDYDILGDWRTEGDTSSRFDRIQIFKDTLTWETDFYSNGTYSQEHKMNYNETEFYDGTTVIPYKLENDKLIVTLEDGTKGAFKHFFLTF